MHEILQWAGLVSPAASVGAVAWGAVKAWGALRSRVDALGASLERCGKSVEEFTDRLHGISERLTRTEERVRGLERACEVFGYRDHR